MLEELKEEVLQANLQLPKLGLVLFTWGNVSGLDPQGRYVCIKPSGVAYSFMEIEDMVITDLEGNLVEGNRKPSSDLHTHIVLYRHFKGCKAIVHTHSRHATSWAQAGMDIQPYGTTHADYFYGPVPCTRPMEDNEIAGEYEKQTGEVIVETFKRRNIDPDQMPSVIVKSHGPFSWGKTPAEAVHNAAVLEELAAMAAETRLLHPETPAITKRLLDRHYLRKHGKDAYYGQ